VRSVVVIFSSLLSRAVAASSSSALPFFRLSSSLRNAQLTATTLPWSHTQARYFHNTNSLRATEGLSVHRDTEDNNEHTPFEFTQENYKIVETILKKYPTNYKLSAAIPLLHLAQSQVGWVPLAAMNKVAKILDVPPMNIYETATFYTMFHRKKKGKYLVEVCTTTPCEICGSNTILDTIQKHLGIHVGETTKDGLFTLGEVECLGACVNAPMIQINEEYYEDLTPETTIKLLDALKNNQRITPGPQNGRRRVAEPFDAKTTLLEPDLGNYAPRLEALDKEAKEKQTSTGGVPNKPPSSSPPAPPKS